MRKTQMSPIDINDLSWRNHPGGRKIADHPSGFWVIIPNNMPQLDALFCPVCGCSLTANEDAKSYREKSACDHCVNKYYYSNAKEWDSGWRPDVTFCSHRKTIIVGE